MGSRRILPFAAGVRSWGDHAGLVYGFKGRRVNLKQPEKSLILRKRGFLADARSMIKLPIEAHDSLIFLDAQ